MLARSLSRSFVRSLSLLHVAAVLLLCVTERGLVVLDALRRTSRPRQAKQRGSLVFVVCRLSFVVVFDSHQRDRTRERARARARLNQTPTSLRCLGSPRFWLPPPRIDSPQTNDFVRRTERSADEKNLPQRKTRPERQCVCVSDCVGVCGQGQGQDRRSDNDDERRPPPPRKTTNNDKQQTTRNTRADDRRRTRPTTTRTRQGETTTTNSDWRLRDDPLGRRAVWLAQRRGQHTTNNTRTHKSVRRQPTTRAEQAGTDNPPIQVGLLCIFSSSSLFFLSFCCLFVFLSRALVCFVFCVFCWLTLFFFFLSANRRFHSRFGTLADRREHSTTTTTMARARTRTSTHNCDFFFGRRTARAPSCLTLRRRTLSPVNESRKSRVERVLCLVFCFCLFVCSPLFFQKGQENNKFSLFFRNQEQGMSEAKRNII